MRLIWSKDLEIGMPDLDAEHRTLIDQFNGMVDAVTAACAPAAMLAAYDLWANSLTRHFQTEAKLLARLDTPAGARHREDHLREHATFLDHARTLRRQLAADGRGQPEMDWLALHLPVIEMVRADFEMVGHLLRQGLLRIESGLEMAP